MIELHSVLGLILVILAVLLLVANLMNSRSTVVKRFRSVFIGLLDLQVLLGIIAFFIHPMSGLFILHPVIMVVAVGILHVMTKPSRSPSVRIGAYASATVLLILGVLAGRL
ncbi:hypothetical protein LLE49_03550 [Alicyclobacillus tolerans]|uniref:hypothetical protein n=1 Tax=Alicyclobacillus tolerans TaxID=90970 RepID=UPI001F1CF285|nr:hypothetical protein [Alicyclobacillus tolerans]MCF8563814.1 hypothetical protein [Alicyclobacillus tolerans]